MRSMHCFIIVLIFLTTACDTSTGVQSSIQQATAPILAMTSVASPQPTQLQVRNTDIPLPMEKTALPTIPVASVAQLTTQNSNTNTSVGSQTASPVGTVAHPLLEGWQRYAWQGLSIPIPPKGQWVLSNSADVNGNGLPVVAAGTITYPTITEGVELPYGPSFIILQFAGSLDDWLDLERHNSPAGNPIEAKTIRDTVIANLPAKAYQHAVTGTGVTEYYAVKLTDDKLLWIITQDAQNPIYRQVIENIILNRYPQ